MLDVLFKNAQLIDGTGAPAWRGDLGIAEGCIQWIGRESHAQAVEVVDCEGLALAPGFIDAHTHDDALVLERAARGQAHPKLSQGVTTVITGNCGVSAAPLQASDVPAPLDILGLAAYRFGGFAAYLDALTAHQPALNVAALVGHTTLRVKHVRNVELAANAREVEAMAADVAEALHAGAWGMSTGVYYPPARAATTAELIGVAQPLRSHGGKRRVRGVITMHLRDEGEHIDAAMREAFAVGAAIGCELVLSHHKLMGVAQHGKSVATLAAVSKAALGQRVCLDCYPYDASSTMLLPERVAQSRAVRITWSRAQPDAAGRMLHELAAEQGISPEAMARALLPAGAIYFAMDPSDVERILKHELTMIGSDGLAHDAQPHPRLWGSFSRVLGHFSRDRGLFSLEAAIHKMTGLTARRFGLDQANAQQPARGLLAQGAAADLVLFDPHRIADQATYDHPTRASVGVERVYVNGQLASGPQGVVHARAGRVLRRV